MAGGADNLQDPFNTVGRGDPMETAALLVMAGHLLPADAYHAVSAASRLAMGLEPVSRSRPDPPPSWSPLPAASLREAVAMAPSGRVVIHRGTVVRR